MLVSQYFSTVCKSNSSAYQPSWVTLSLSFNSYSGRIGPSRISSRKLWSRRTNLHAVVATTTRKHWSFASSVFDTFSMSSIGQVINSKLHQLIYKIRIYALCKFFFSKTRCQLRRLIWPFMVHFPVFVILQIGAFQHACHKTESGPCWSLL